MTIWGKVLTDIDRCRLHFVTGAHTTPEIHNNSILLQHPPHFRPQITADAEISIHNNLNRHVAA